MKIYILGPVYNKNYIGGVATFDESLCQSFIALGHESKIFTTQKEKATNKSLPIIQTDDLQICKILKEEEPDIVIASLQYGKFFLKKTKACKILFLHGFFNFQVYGILKTLLAVCYTKLVSSKSSIIIANSNFTAIINKKIWNINVDNVVKLGVSENFLTKIKKNDIIKSANNRTILYAGRLLYSKGVDKIIKAVANLKKQNIPCRLLIAGNGKDESEFKNLSIDIGCNAEFLGRIEHSSMAEIYANAEIFISLNETEPYGLVYTEALLSGCKIICPNTGGQMEYLTNYMDRVEFIDLITVFEIEKCLKASLNKNIGDLDTNKMVSEFSFLNTAQNILYAVKAREEKQFS